ncbi:MAG: hypothetical protein EHM88_04835 [Candidatus Rokuibacteriota bacterium]|nr:MAG: hypothetical protein EHM88_04835 [Candidatus Rokubacteria bacterium]
MSLAEDGNVRSTISLPAAWIGSQMASSGLPGLSIGRSHGEPVVFELGPGRNVTRRKVGENFMTPVGEW